MAFGLPQVSTLLRRHGTGYLPDKPDYRDEPVAKMLGV
jgi:hypothetical protein